MLSIEIVSIVGILIVVLLSVRGARKIQKNATETEGIVVRISSYISKRQILGINMSKNRKMIFVAYEDKQGQIFENELYNVKNSHTIEVGDIVKIKYLNDEHNTIMYSGKITGHIKIAQDEDYFQSLIDQIYM